MSNETGKEHWFRQTWWKINAEYFVQAAEALAITYEFYDAKIDDPDTWQGRIGLIVHTSSPEEVQQLWEMHQRVLEDISDIPGLGDVAD